MSLEIIIRTRCIYCGDTKESNYLRNHCYAFAEDIKLDWNDIKRASEHKVDDYATAICGKCLLLGYAPDLRCSDCGR